MTESTRALALSGALNLSLAQLAKGQEIDVIATAELFRTFLDGEATTAPAAPAAKPVKVAAPVKPAKVATPKAPVEEEAEAEVTDGPTKEQVGKAVEGLLAANKRKEAIALMKKYGATSVSSLDEKHYPKFLSEADEILLAA